MVRSLPRRRMPVRLTALLGLLLTAALVAPLPAIATPQRNVDPDAGPTTANGDHGKSSWTRVNGKPAPTRNGKKPAVKPEKLAAWTLNRGQLEKLLRQAPRERLNGAAAQGLVVSLPAPDGTFQRFELVSSPVMEPGLAAKHPDIATYRGRGLDDAAATIRADITPLGFHASVRSPNGAWYIDPYYHLDQGLYASYYGRDLKESADGVFVERDADGAELSVDRGFYQPTDTVSLAGSGFAADATISIRVAELDGSGGARTLTAQADALGSFGATFMASPDRRLETFVIEASDGDATATTTYQVVRDDDPTVDPPTGDVLRVYRLAMVTDPGYATFFGGSANVTAAKVTLINRVTQLYEDDLSIRLVLVANNDLLNFDTWDEATAPNGPCGAAACFTQSQVTGCSSLARIRTVIGQIIGASNYDIGHLALGQPGGGIAQLGVVGRANKAQGCTGIVTPVGDFYAVDYVAHEMGHQFSGNHTFNGNQLNCSGGNRSNATSVEPGSGSSIMAYAGICLTDDLQPHSDPYFSQRSLQEISTYTSGNQPSINEVQTVALRHFGGGNEVQVATFGPGYAPQHHIMPVTVAINAVPSATSRGGAELNGSTVTIATGSVHRLVVGDVVTISGVAESGYNGTYTVTAVPTTRSFQYTTGASGLPDSGGGLVTLAEPGATQSGNTVTIRTATPHGRSVGDVVTITGVAAGGYNGTFAVTAVPSPRTLQYTSATAGLPPSGPNNSGTNGLTYFSPFQVRIGGAESAVIGGTGLPYGNTNIQDAINAIPGFAGTVAVTGATGTGFTITYGGAAAGLDVSNAELVGLACGGCFSSVEETNHGGDPDSFRLAYDGAVSAPITIGVNYTTAGIAAALAPILPVGVTGAVQAFGGGNTVNNQGFQVTFGGAAAASNVPVLLGVEQFTAGASGWVSETDKGGAVDNKGGIIEPTGNTWPAVTVPGEVFIPLRTPFTLTGSAVDNEGDPLTYAWEQNDRGASPNAAGTSLLSNTKTNGPLFAMFPKSGIISDADALLYGSPGQNHVTTNPSRTFPDLAQIIDNNTNADTGVCPDGPISPYAPVTIKECFAEFLPTADYIGFAGFNASPLSLNFRLTARDGRGGVNAADTRLRLVPAAGPFLVATPSSALRGGSATTITWDVAGTDLAPISASDVKVSLSVDGGFTYPHVLAESTANDGSESLVIPNVATTTARIKVEAVGNVFFDISNANVAIKAVPVVSSSLNGGSASVQYTDALAPAVTVSATDADSSGSNLTAVATGLPAGLSLSTATTSGAGVLPGTRTWTLVGNVTAPPASYPVTVAVTDEDGGSGSTAFTVVVTPENADVTYSGDMLAFSPPGSNSATVELRATVRDSAILSGSGDTAAGDVRNATVTFKEGAMTLCANVPVQLVGSETTTGSASCAVSLAQGAHAIDLVVGGSYTATGSGLVEVAPADGTYITGGGFRILTASAGSYAAPSGSKMNVAFNVKYTRNLKNVVGHASIRFTRDARTYELRSTAIDSLGLSYRTASGATCAGPVSATCFGIADFRAKATLVDVTDPLNPTNVARNLTLRLTVTDRGDSGQPDTIGVTATNGGTLVFSSQWNGTSTVEGPLDGGNLVVH